MPRKLRITPQRTHPLVWVAAIICSIVAIAVIISGIAVFIGYIIIHPRVPFISVTSASLDKFNLDYVGLLETQISIDVRAENDNAKAHASFSDVSFILSLHGLEMAKLVNNPFDVEKNSSIVFHYVVESSPIPLDSELVDYVQLSMKRNQIIFNLKGNARARWRVGLLGSVKFRCHLDCNLQFHLNGSYTSSRCNSKSR